MVTPGAELARRFPVPTKSFAVTLILPPLVAMSSKKYRGARKALSMFLCQATGGTIVSMAQGAPLPKTADYPKGIDVSKTEGAGLYISNDCQTEDRFYGSPFAQVTNSKYMLELDEEAGTATVSVISSGTLCVPLNEDLENMNNVAGTFEWKLQYKFDTNGEEPDLVDVHLGQTFEP